MRLSDVYPVTETLEPVPLAEVAAAEAELGFRFPTGYAEFMAALGRGEFNGFVNVFAPQDVRASVAQHRQTMEQYPEFWSEGNLVLNGEERRRSILLANTIDGDMFVFLPSLPDTLYLLPRHNNLTYRVGEGLFEALDWFFTSGEYVAPAHTSFRYFEPFSNRGYVNLWNGPSVRAGQPTLSYEPVRDWLLERHPPTHLILSPEPAGMPPDLQAMAIGVEMGSEIRFINPDDARYLHAFYREFGGFASCYENLGEETVTIQIRHDAGAESDSLRQFVAHLQANGFQVMEQGVNKG
jgi:hypothetical protein